MNLNRPYLLFLRRYRDMIAARVANEDIRAFSVSMWQDIDLRVDDFFNGSGSSIPAWKKPQVRYGALAAAICGVHRGQHIHRVRYPQG